MEMSSFPELHLTITTKKNNAETSEGHGTAMGNTIALLLRGHGFKVG